MATTASRTDARDARSRGTTSSAASGVPRAIDRTAAAVFSGLRAASTTVAPAPASARAVARPSPPLAPVTTAVRPRRSTMSRSDQVMAADRLNEWSFMHRKPMRERPWLPHPVDGVVRRWGCLALDAVMRYEARRTGIGTRNGGRRLGPNVEHPRPGHWGKSPRRGSASRAGEHAAIERLTDLAPPYRPVHAHGHCSMCDGLGRFGHDTRSIDDG